MEPGGLDFQEAWIQGAAHVLAWAIFGWGAVVAMLVFLAMLAVKVRRRHFWCHQAWRVVDVEIEVRGFPGFRRPTAVLSCSAFEPPTVVGCRRHCLAERSGRSSATDTRSTAIPF